MAIDCDLSQQLSKIEQESPIFFGLKWSGVGLILALCILLGSCESMLPKETPRYNSVIGERRVPVMNASMLADKADNPSETLPASPVPMVQPQRNQPSAPARPPQPAIPPAVQQVAPPKQIIAAPISQPIPDANVIVQPQPPSMVDQVSGVLYTQPAPAAEIPTTEPTAYPTLAPTSAPARPADSSSAAQQLEAEMDALERELEGARQEQNALQELPPSIQQQDVTALEPKPMEPSTPALTATQKPVPNSYSIAPPTKTQQTSPYQGQPSLLPPPPAPNAVASWPAPQPTINYSQQPLPDSAFTAQAPATAPVISDPALTAQEQPYAPQPAPYAPPVRTDVPAPPPVYADPAIGRLPSGLIPPDLSAQFEQGYLPSSRYDGRRPIN